MDLNEFMASSNARARRGRARGRGLILMVLALTAFLFVAAPNGPQAMYLHEPGALNLVLPFIGIVGIVIGLLWMVRILRADPEPEVKGWRYRDF